MWASEKNERVIHCDFEKRRILLFHLEKPELRINSIQISIGYMEMLVLFASPYSLKKSINIDIRLLIMACQVIFIPYE